MPRTTHSSTFGNPPNTARLSEVRCYRLKDGSPLRFVAEVSGPIGDKAIVEQNVEELHESFRLIAMEQHHAIAEVGEQRVRKSQYLFTAPFTEPGME